MVSVEWAEELSRNVYNGSICAQTRKVLDATVLTDAWSPTFPSQFLCTAESRKSNSPISKDTDINGFFQLPHIAVQGQLHH